MARTLEPVDPDKTFLAMPSVPCSFRAIPAFSTTSLAFQRLLRFAPSLRQGYMPVNDTVARLVSYRKAQNGRSAPLQGESPMWTSVKNAVARVLLHACLSMVVMPARKRS